MEDNEELFLYMAQLLHEGEYNSGVTWKEFIESYEYVSGENSENAVSRLRERKMLGDFSEKDAFTYFPSSDVEIGDSVMEDALSKISTVSIVANISMSFRLEPSLVDLILSSKFYSEEHAFGGKERALIPVVLSERFYNDRRVQEYLDRMLMNANRKFQYAEYAKRKWFIELIFMIKRGFYGNGGYSYVANLSEVRKTALLDGSYNLLVSGSLYELLLDFRSVISSADVDKKMRKFQKMDRKASRVMGMYSYLSIGNDVLVGIEFLIGSFEFLPATIFPSANVVTGVYLFIAGSAELLIRPMIEMARRVHLRIINNRNL
ncbi:MAG: YrhK family protein [Candidatus Thermoplasmatota archaeon]|nr:YrhK family protein [Candidatus Thermoplasmatota archaeon]MCL5889098.1 YrhK family protein [Candidatus Thermoplasmatota archaeon]